MNAGIGDPRWRLLNLITFRFRMFCTTRSIPLVQTLVCHDVVNGYTKSRSRIISSNGIEVIVFRSNNFLNVELTGSCFLMHAPDAVYSLKNSEWLQLIFFLRCRPTSQYAVKWRKTGRTGNICISAMVLLFGFQNPPQRARQGSTEMMLTAADASNAKLYSEPRHFRNIGHRDDQPPGPLSTWNVSLSFMPSRRITR